MAEALREQALAKIKTKLEAMTGTRPWGGTYPNNPIVAREWKDIQQVNQFPHFIVLEDDGSTLEVEATGSANNAFFLHAFYVEVVCYVQGDDQVIRSTWIQRSWDDTVRQLLKNCTLDGVVRDLCVDGPLVVDKGEFDQLGSWLGAWVQRFRVDIDEEMETQ